MPSSIPAAIDGLLALIGAQSAASGVTVSDGFLKTFADADLIAIGGTVAPTAEGGQLAVVLGNRKRRENYSIAGLTTAYVSDRNQKAARDRAFALFAAVEKAVMASPNLGGALTTGVALVESTLVEQTDIDSGDKGRRCTVNFTVTVSNNDITP